MSVILLLIQLVLCTGAVYLVYLIATVDFPAKDLGAALIKLPVMVVIGVVATKIHGAIKDDCRQGGYDGDNL